MITLTTIPIWSWIMIFLFFCGVVSISVKALDLTVNDYHKRKETMRRN